MINIAKEGNNKIRYRHHFYNTNSFEVYCFCRISIFDKKNFIDIEQNDNSKIVTDYFFVGGYQKRLNKGVIKLYKINRKCNFLDTGIKFIDDVEIQKNEVFKGFYGPISGITQSSVDGKIFVTCWDGNVYLFDHPNINCLLDWFKDIKISLNN